MHLRVVGGALDDAGGNPTKALRLVLGSAIEKLKPDGKPNLSAPEWLLYNILEMRFIQGRRIREIADRLAISESDLYRKQRVAIGQVAQVLTEMEQGNGLVPPASHVDGAAAGDEKAGDVEAGGAVQNAPNSGAPADKRPRPAPVAEGKM